MSESSNLCLSCGLCCDGSLIGYVKLDNEELPAVRKVLSIEEEGGHGFFLQPCNKYCDGCTIYANRPNRCESFKCGLLKSFEDKALDFEKASEIIKDIKQQKLVIQHKMTELDFKLQSDSFFFKIVELKKILLKNKVKSIATQNQLALIIDLEKLNSQLQKQFDLSID